jgi:hypothetical protein
MSRTMMNNLRQSLNATKERVWTMIRPQQQQSDDLESSLTTVTASAKESTEKEKKQVGVFSLFLLGMSLGWYLLRLFLYFLPVVFFSVLFIIVLFFFRASCHFFHFRLSIIFLTRRCGNKARKLYN